MFKNLKIKYKIIVPLLVVLLIVFIIKLVTTIHSLNKTFHSETSNLVNSNIEEVNILFEEYKNMALYIAIICSQMEITKDSYNEFYKTGNFENASLRIKNQFNEINQAILKNTGFEPRIHFHLPPAISFCRTWSNARGDTISDFRNSLLEVSKTHTPSKGIEIGRGGYVIRGIAPIFSDEGNYYGSVEVFFDIDVILQSTSVRLEEDFAIFMKTNFLEIATNFLEDSSTNISRTEPIIQDYILVNHTKNFRLENISKNTSNLKSNDNNIFQAENYKYAIIPIESFNKEIQGIWLLQIDISAQIKELKKSIVLAIGEFLLLVLVIFSIISIISFQLFIKRIFKVDLALKKLSKGEPIEKFAISQNDEIGSMQNSLNQLNESITQKVDFAVEISKNNLSANYQPISEHDKLGNSLLKMQKELVIHRNHLEKAVKERTIELEEALMRLKKMQEQVIQSEKMASLGILTAGVAHEINNPLNYIIGSYYGLNKCFKEICNDDTKVKQLLESIKIGVDRVTNIVKGLNQFSQNHDRLDEICDIHAIIDNCLLMLNNQLQNRIEIKKTYFSKSLQVRGNVSNFHQVFLNILNNAVQAIPDEGTIEINTVLANETIEIQIRDTGCGISKENLSKITDPFFTTKEPGKGTGLGLSIAYNIIREHKGKLEFISETGKGATVSVILPIILKLQFSP